MFKKYFRRIFSQLHEKKKKKTGLNWCVHDFYVDYKAFDISDVTDIHKYLISYFINFHPNECSQKLYYYPFAVNLERCAGSSKQNRRLKSKSVHYDCMSR